RDPLLNPELVVPGAPIPSVVPRIGHGALVIHDYGLADVGTDRLPRLVYLDFEVCLAWDAAWIDPRVTAPAPPQPLADLLLNEAIRAVAALEGALALAHIGAMPAATLVQTIAGVDA